MAEQEDVNRDEEEESIEAEAVVIPLREPEEEIIALAGLIPQDIRRIRRTDPFLYHSIVNEITGNNVCNFERFRDDGDAAAGGTDVRAFLGLSRPLSLPDLSIVSASNVDRRLGNVIEGARFNNNQNNTGGSLSAPARLGDGRDYNTQTNHGVQMSQPPNIIAIQSSAGSARRLRRSRSLPLLSNIRVADRTVTRRRRFSTELYSPDLLDFMPPDVIAGANHAGDDVGDRILHDLLLNRPLNSDGDSDSSTDRAAGN